jgi:sulfopyruvate decarboxylase subunit beta
MLNRLEVLVRLSPLLRTSIVVTPLGNTSREVYAIADRPSNFYLLGSMGLSIPVALGLALGQTSTVVAFEGDGSCLMNLGGLATAARYGPPNLKILILDNEAYESTGGQRTHTHATASLATIARGCGIDGAREIRDDGQLAELMAWLQAPQLQLAVVKTAMTQETHPRIPIAPPAIFQRVRQALTSSPEAAGALVKGLECRH